MKTFDKIISNVIEELSSPASIAVNPQQVQNDVKKMMGAASPATKAAFQAITDPVETATEISPSEDLIKKIEALDFSKISDEDKEKFLTTFAKKGFPLQLSQNENGETEEKNTAVEPAVQNVYQTPIKKTNPAAYGV